jgi:hypothetical protein
MGIGPVPARAGLLEDGLRLEDIDRLSSAQAFAAQVIACHRGSVSIPRLNEQQTIALGRDRATGVNRRHWLTKCSGERQSAGSNPLSVGHRPVLDLCRPRRRMPGSIDLDVSDSIPRLHESTRLLNAFAGTMGGLAAAIRRHQLFTRPDSRGAGRLSAVGGRASHERGEDLNPLSRKRVVACLRSLPIPTVASMQESLRRGR